jgi:hypothetical protein
MMKVALMVLATAALVQASLSVAADKPTSYVPHPHSSHVYGAPIQPAILGHAKKKRPSSPQGPHP